MHKPKIEVTLIYFKQIQIFTNLKKHETLTSNFDINSRLTSPTHTTHHTTSIPQHHCTTPLNVPTQTHLGYHQSLPPSCAQTCVSCENSSQRLLFSFIKVMNLREYSLSFIHSFIHLFIHLCAPFRGTQLLSIYSYL